MVGFSLLLPESWNVSAERLTFAAGLVPSAGAGTAKVPPVFHEFTVEPVAGWTQRLGPGRRLPSAPAFTDVSAAELGPLVEGRLLDRVARRRHMTLRLDLINKCNLRCVMCHYSNESIAGRPAQRITPEQFASFFDSVAPMVRDAMLSCGDEPLMSPHFEAIVRHIAARDPEVRITFCTNGMLLTERIAGVIMAANVHRVLFSFDGVESATLHRIRVGSDYRRIVRNILGLARARTAAGRASPHFVFNFVMLDSNIHEAPAFVALAMRLGGGTIDFRHVVPMDTYDIGHESLERKPAKYNHYRALIREAARGMEIYIPPPLEAAGPHDPSGDPTVSLDEFHAVLRELGEDPANDAGARPPRGDGAGEPPMEIAQCFCDRPFREVMIRDQRDVYPCAWHKDRMGALGDGGTLDGIFFGVEFQRVRLAMLDPLGAPGCRDCPIKASRLPTQLLGEAAQPPGVRYSSLAE